MEASQVLPIEKKEKTGLGTFWKRFRAVFRDRSTALHPSSVRQVSQQLSSQPEATRESSKEEALPAPSTPDTNLPEAEPKSEQQPEVSTIETKAEDSTKTDLSKASAGMTQSRVEHEKRLERIHAAFKKYDYVLGDEDQEVPITLSQSRTKVPYERIQKSVRMRVKYTCHNCRTVYGHDRICLSCQHKRCSECVRYPPKKIKVRKPKEEPEVIVVDTAPIVDAEQQCACHECQTEFEPGAEECPNCHHLICSICLKEAMVTISNEPPPSTVMAEADTKPPQEAKPPDPPVTTTSTATS